MLGKNCSIQIPPDKHVRKSLVKQIPPDDLNRGDNINQVHIFPSFIFIFAIVVLLPPSRNLDPGSHSKRLFPLPTTVRAFRFYREKDSAFSSLVDSRRIRHTPLQRNAGRSLRELYLSLYTCCQNRNARRCAKHKHVNTLLLALHHNARRCTKTSMQYDTTTSMQGYVQLLVLACGCHSTLTRLALFKTFFFWSLLHMAPKTIDLTTVVLHQ